MAAIAAAQKKYEARPSTWTPDGGYWLNSSGGTTLTTTTSGTGAYVMPATTSYTMANLRSE